MKQTRLSIQILDKRTCSSYLFALDESLLLFNAFSFWRLDTCSHFFLTWPVQFSFSKSFNDFSSYILLSQTNGLHLFSMYLNTFFLPRAWYTLTGNYGNLPPADWNPSDRLAKKVGSLEVRADLNSLHFSNSSFF